MMALFGVGGSGGSHLIIPIEGALTLAHMTAGLSWNVESSAGVGLGCHSRLLNEPPDSQEDGRSVQEELDPGHST